LSVGGRKWAREDDTPLTINRYFTTH
jgi:hypothetical protein